MLDDMNSQVSDDLPRPPAGRHAATRPAGPPTALPVFSDLNPAPAPAGADTPPAKRASRSVKTATSATSTRATARRGASAETPPAPQAEATPPPPSTGPAPVRGRRRASATPAEDAATSAPEAAPAPAADEPAPRSRGRRSSAQAGADAPAVDETLAAVIAETVAPARRGRRAVAAEAAEQPAVDREQVLAHLAEAIAETSTTGRSRRRGRPAASDVAEVAPEVVDADETTEEGDGAEGSVHRRRRRGGRRRRRGGENEAAETDAPMSREDDDEDEGDEPGHRRRRRRRRHGEDASGADDDPGDVVVRVREPRSRTSSSDEVSGIEGSTRLEAKRQRRKESRAQGRRAPILTEAEFLARRESVRRVMVIRQRDEFTQIAVLEDGVLVEHYVDRASATSLTGSIYLGKVQNVLPGMEAAFIDIGRSRNAVLYAGEVAWDQFGAVGRNHKVEEVFSPGQVVLVQVSKDPVGAKGARLTGHVSLPGRYVVYSPDGQLSGISRKLPDTERNRLKRILGDVVEENASVIVRTAAEGASPEELVHDVDRLRAQWEVISKKVAQGNAPQLLYAEPDLTLRIVRDLFTEDFAELVVAGNGGPVDAFDTIDAYVRHVAPHLADRMVRWDIADRGDPFAQYRVDEQIAKALERKVFLPSGGSLVIDRTEAMTVIDVNTGKFTGSGSNLEETVTRNNLEAAEEIVRQLRLRDLGGIVVIDFVDMVLPRNRELLLRRLVECLGRDRTRHQVSEVTSLGLVQLTRKRIGTGLAEAFTEECEPCGGRGYIRHDVPVASQAPADGGERRSSRGRSSGGGGRRGGRAASKE